MGRPSKPTTFHTWMMINGKSGEHFYTDEKDKTLTASASHYKRKILTERLLVVTTHKKQPSVKFITKVTLL